MTPQERAEKIVSDYFGDLIPEPVTVCSGLVSLISAEIEAHASAAVEEEYKANRKIMDSQIRASVLTAYEDAAKIVETEHKVCLPLMCETAKRIRARAAGGGEQMNYDELKEKTEIALRNPKAGMRFHEMYSHWMYVLAAEPNGVIITREFGGHPANPPSDQIKFKTFRSLEEFYSHARYKVYCDDEAFARIKNEFIVTAVEVQNDPRRT